MRLPTQCLLTCDVGRTNLQWLLAVLFLTADPALYGLQQAQSARLWAGYGVNSLLKTASCVLADGVAQRLLNDDCTESVCQRVTQDEER
jgi:hypothetical protein